MPPGSFLACPCPRPAGHKPTPMASPAGTPCPVLLTGPRAAQGPHSETTARSLSSLLCTTGEHDKGHPPGVYRVTTASRRRVFCSPRSRLRRGPGAAPTLKMLGSVSCSGRAQPPPQRAGTGLGGGGQDFPRTAAVWAAFWSPVTETAFLELQGLVRTRRLCIQPTRPLPSDTN